MKDRNRRRAKTSAACLKLVLNYSQETLRKNACLLSRQLSAQLRACLSKCWQSLTTFNIALKARDKLHILSCSSQIRQRQHLGKSKNEAASRTDRHSLATRRSSSRGGIHRSSTRRVSTAMVAAVKIASHGADNGSSRTAFIAQDLGCPGRATHLPKRSPPRLPWRWMHRIGVISCSCGSAGPQVTASALWGLGLSSLSLLTFPCKRHAAASASKAELSSCIALTLRSTSQHHHHVTCRAEGASHRTKRFDVEACCCDRARLRPARRARRSAVSFRFRLRFSPHTVQTV